jgi:hypothetical protein
MIPIQTKTISPRKTPGCIMLGVTLFLLYKLDDKPGISDITLIIGSGVILIFLFYFYILSISMVNLEDSGITFKSLLRKEKFIAWSEIRQVSHEWFAYSHTAILHWHVHYAANQKHNIEPWNFSKKDIRAIAEALVIKCPGALLDKNIVEVSNGKFPWYFI